MIMTTSQGTQVFLDVKIGDNDAKRITIELDNDVSTNYPNIPKLN